MSWFSKHKFNIVFQIQFDKIRKIINVSQSFDCVDLQPAQDGLLGAQLEDDDQAGDGEREPGMDFG